MRFNRPTNLIPTTFRHQTIYVTKHLHQGIESNHFRVKKNMPWVSGFQSFGTARHTIQGFEAMLWLRKGFGFAGAWRCANRTRCSRSVSDFRKLTKLPIIGLVRKGQRFP
jgi:transposase, IS6 family